MCVEGKEEEEVRVESALAEARAGLKRDIAADLCSDEEVVTEACP